MKRVKYFDTNDFCFAMNLDKIELLKIPKYSNVSINDAIEFYEINKYFDNGVRSENWTVDEYDLYLTKSKELYKITLRFFSSISDDNIVKEYAQVEIWYKTIFWELFDKCELYNKISTDVFETLIYSKYVAPFDLFSYKKIVMAYGNVLRSYILEHERCISVVLHWYEQNFNKKNKLYRPKEFTDDDICSYLNSYVLSENANLNYLKKIQMITKIKVFPITDEIRLKAKHRYQEKFKELVKTGSSYEYGIQLVFSADQVEEKKIEDDCNKLIFSYSTKWLGDTLDYPSILNNFIYIFEFVDVPQMRSLHVSNKSKADVFEKVIQDESSNIYPCFTVFNYHNVLASMQMNAYYNFLKTKKIRLEDVIEDFFTNYLQKEFDCCEMRIKMPSESTEYLEKCIIIVSAFETILRQFKLYVEKGSVDFELIGMSTTPVKFDDIPSLVNKKYVYGIGEDFKNIINLMFSDQCLYTYIPRVNNDGEKYNCLADLLQNEKIYLTDYKEIDKSIFEYLKDNDLVEISDNGLISIKNYDKLFIFKDLFENEVISKWHYSSNSQKIISEMVETGILIEKSSLFSDPEIKYLNYMLNRSEYNNGLELRNKYVHGIQQVNLDENEHMRNYFALLRIFILLVVKINDDFDLHDLINKEDKNKIN